MAIKYKLFLKNLKNISVKPLYQIIGIFLLALLLRTVNLENYPVGLHVDEIKVGWNAESLIHTLKDDQGNFLPVYYNTFGDYRPTGILYLSIPAILIFNNSVFAIRVTSSLFGSLTVFAVFLLVNILTKPKRNIGIWAALILAISPWHIEVSRATSEVAISTFFILFAIYFYFRYFKEVKLKYFSLTLLMVIISYLLYHSARILLPIYLSLTFFYCLKKYKKVIIAPLIFSILLTLIFSLNKNSLERFSQVSIFKSENVIYELEKSNEPKIIVYSRNLIKEYGKYLSTDFLIGESARPYRYLTVGVGLLNYIDVILLVYGTFLIFNKKDFRLIILFLLISPLPAILTIEDSPNLHRAFYMIPFISMIEGYAISQIKHKKIILTILAIGVAYFVYSYFAKSNLHIPYQKNLYIDSPTYRNIGYIELAKKLEGYEKQYDLIYVTNFPDNLYPWYAFLNNKKPSDFNTKSFTFNSNERRYENIIFTDKRCPSDYVFKENSKNILVIDAEGCGVESKIKDGLPIELIEKITRPDNSNVYYLLKSI